MGITFKCNTKYKEALKLFNHINTYLFEQECGELKDSPKVKAALSNVAKELAKLIKNS